MDGFINLLKPPGMTSSDAVIWARRLLGEKKIGHAGTLDPNAAGVLPLCVGKAARLFDFLTDKRKTYLAETLLGVETDTCDGQGRLVARSDASDVTDARIDAALERFRGRIRQVPPVYSAIKVKGERLYHAARAGEDVEVPPRDVDVFTIERVSPVRNARFLMRVTCGRGTYIRSLCRDIGRELGTRGSMSFLVREAAGPFEIIRAATVEELIDASVRGTLGEWILPVDWPLQGLARIDLPARLSMRAANGNALPAGDCGAEEGVLYRAYADGRLLFIGRVEGNLLVPKTMLGSGIV